MQRCLHGYAYCAPPYTHGSAELEYRLTLNRRDQKLTATVAKHHRDPGVDQLYRLLGGT
jgi:hypothetical protein